MEQDINRHLRLAGFLNENQCVPANVKEMANHIIDQDETISSMCMMNSKLQKKIDKIGDFKEIQNRIPEDTVELRIPVVVWRDQDSDEIHWQKLDSSSTNEAMRDILSIHAPSHAIQSVITARVPVPPKPVIHEVKGGVETPP